ncbi:hypothetical protein predicted by Glimmer/Critica [Sorangium cellulosum So ce56]|uniref:Uncharacterized protein n=1 Tax=Sorangium cellulosum (strain So ce56) TaxID=448385 RepID=A9GA37_SORC5|nr:hypothetical protein predicted by Glimmer/Critica [Sorangium cellulosum So ce56]
MVVRSNDPDRRAGPVEVQGGLSLGPCVVGDLH